MAAAYNDIPQLNYFIGLDAHWTLDIQDKAGWTPLHRAAYLANFDAINLLLEHGASPKVYDYTFMSFYDVLVRHDHHELFSMFIKEAMDFDKRRNRK